MCSHDAYGKKKHFLKIFWIWFRSRQFPRSLQRIWLRLLLRLCRGGNGGGFAADFQVPKSNSLLSMSTPPSWYVYPFSCYTSDAKSSQHLCLNNRSKTGGGWAFTVAVYVIICCDGDMVTSWTTLTGYVRVPAHYFWGRLHLDGTSSNVSETKCAPNSVAICGGVSIYILAVVGEGVGGVAFSDLVLVHDYTTFGIHAMWIAGPEAHGLVMYTFLHYTSCLIICWC